MHAKNIKNIEQRGGFTLIELITAMAITAILVVVIMQLTNQGIGLWKAVREDTSTAASARMALQSISEDLESIQLRGSGKNTQWLYAEVDSAIRGVPKGLSIPKSARLIFFACPPDRNPAVEATSSMRNNARRSERHLLSPQIPRPHFEFAEPQRRHNVFPFVRYLSAGCFSSQHLRQHLRFQRFKNIVQSV